ncbi:hypothetical protein [Mesorhizobium sp. B1-1-5]|uniref:hypothetical protein n=1 Tax=Mesorhizobium sp. B1-1-5 TaxID=2589979 RepID=UPI001128CE5E|nr:hypothetical protein [Mesorhizobium sp. B1-1-5]TPN65707.1 hypothetical protein FJ980_33340 [Mesorhizobium sp. B1-1-5]
MNVVAPGVDDMANALRRYVVARAHGRSYPEYARYNSFIACWVASDEPEAAGRCEGRRFRRVRRPGLPWCRWLGGETTISADHALQAFFELQASEAHDWNRLLKEVSRDRRRALRDWKRSGREILALLRMQETHGPDVQMSTGLAAEFRMPGKGMRSLRKV